MDTKEELHYEVDSLRSKVTSNEMDLRTLRGEVSSVKATVDSLSIDFRAANTSIQNMIMSFGTMREKMENIQSTLRAMAKEKDDGLLRVEEVHKEKLSSFRANCDTRVENTNFKITSLSANLTTRLELLDKKTSERDDELEAKIKDMEGKLQNIFWGIFVTVLGWLIKLLYPELGGQ